MYECCIACAVGFSSVYLNDYTCRQGFRHNTFMMGLLTSGQLAKSDGLDPRRSPFKIHSMVVSVVFPIASFPANRPKASISLQALSFHFIF